MEFVRSNLNTAPERRLTHPRLVGSSNSFATSPEPERVIGKRMKSRKVIVKRARVQIMEEKAQKIGDRTNPSQPNGEP